MTTLTDLIRKRLLREVRPDRVGAIFHIFIDPVIKQEGNVPRIATVVGGPQLRRLMSRTKRERVMATYVKPAHQRKNENRKRRSRSRSRCAGCSRRNGN